MELTKDMTGKRVTFKSLKECRGLRTEIIIFSAMEAVILKGAVISGVDTRDNTFVDKNSGFWFAGEWIEEIK